MKKQCSKCEKLKPLSAFEIRHDPDKVRRRGVCKKCRYAQDDAAARLRKFRTNNPGYSTAKNLQWKLRNREKYLAHKAVENAVRSGKLIKKPCRRCGALGAQAHHKDYSKPLTVMWLCRKHHEKVHHG